jgi:hypothetical protein
MKKELILPSGIRIIMKLPTIEELNNFIIFDNYNIFNLNDDIIVKKCECKLKLNDIM